MSVFTDFLRPLSPPPILNYRRRASLNIKSLSLDAKEDSLSSSLPSSISKDDFENNVKKETKKGLGLHARSGTFSSSPRSPHSPTQLSPLGLSRPRSASLCSPRKGFLGLPKTRQPSLKKTPKHGSDSCKDSNTSAIDAALTVIRNQLELLSEEDQLIEERVNKLTTEISQILDMKTKSRLTYSNGSNLFQRPPKNNIPCYKRTLSDEPCPYRFTGGGTLDGNHCNIVLSDLKETCEELAIEKSYEDKIECVPFDLICKKFDDSSSQKRDSFDSLDSSAEAISRSSSNDVCVVIVTDMDTSGEPRVEPVTSQTSAGSSQAEDDVFMSQ